MVPRTKQIFRLKVSLNEVAPPVWRALLVPADVTLAKLHQILQDAMGWTDSHLHCFEVGDRRIGMLDVDEGKQLEDERRVRLRDVMPRPGAHVVYRYDYGDDWEHIIVLESVDERDDRLAYPLCVGGRRACPPDDCGGAGGYEELLTALSDPEHEDHDRLLTWIGGYFDPEAFDPNAVNRALASHR
jgi:Plasmid pRiA4b ORF-3-like protein